MMNRRNFFLATAASAAILSGVTRSHAATYDLIIKGGHVIDPSLRINEVRDVAISGGRIAAVEANIAGDATETIDARGKYVTPGLIDIHTHAGRGGAALALSDGVTAWVDAGSFGADGIDQAVANTAALPNMGRFLINIARTGVAPGGELHDSAMPTSVWRAERSGAIATSSSASRRDCRTMWPIPMISRRSGARRRRPNPSACR